MAQESFFLIGAKPLVEDSPTWKLHQLIDLEAVSRKLKGLYRREESHGGGPERYAPLSMFTLMLLGQWHGLSDAQLEQALKVRIDFMVFTGFEPAAGEFPDASTICRFRNRLVVAKLDQVLLRSTNSQLEQNGLKLQGSRGAILDATIIPSAAQTVGTLGKERKPRLLWLPGLWHGRHCRRLRRTNRSAPGQRSRGQQVASGD